MKSTNWHALTEIVGLFLMFLHSKQKSNKPTLRSVPIATKNSISPSMGTGAFATIKALSWNRAKVSREEK